MRIIYVLAGLAFVLFIMAYFALPHVQVRIDGLLDGVFGNNTKSAVINFQRYYGLKVDGIVGCNTWKKIASIANGMGVSAYTKYYN